MLFLIRKMKTKIPKSESQVQFFLLFFFLTFKKRLFVAQDRDKRVLRDDELSDSDEEFGRRNIDVQEFRSNIIFARKEMTPSESMPMEEEREERETKTLQMSDPSSVQDNKSSSSSVPSNQSPSHPSPNHN